MNNKRIGTQFENEVCELLSRKGFWVHFIRPDARGAQPFDIIAVRNGKVTAIDCKTCAASSFSIRRLEENQIHAFEKWIRCGNEMPLIYVKHNEKIYIIRYDDLKENISIRLEPYK